ncbi:hypothetical protein Avbf_18806 [Armadillidium vulgare]|nr:hypothetical protein Avbf_18806 [Armadillidium vulgare]
MTLKIPINFSEEGMLFLFRFQLEQSLSSENWSKMLRSTIPHFLEFKMPIYSHRNYLNLSSILTTMGFENLFQEEADFSGINGAKGLKLGDLVQLTEFHSIKFNPKLFAARSLKKFDDLFLKGLKGHLSNLQIRISFKVEMKRGFFPMIEHFSMF